MLPSSQSSQYRMLSASGETRWVRVTRQPMVNEEQIIGVQGVMTDITQRVRMAEKLEQEAAAVERQRLARDLHDSVTQTLYSISLYGDAAHLARSAANVDVVGEHLNALRNLVWEAMREMRILLFELRPPLLEEIGLAGALQTRIESVETRTGSAVHFSTEGDRQLPAAVEAEVYRVALEALNNVVKHAHATNVDVHLTVDEARCTLIIQDDGIGFSPAVARHSGGHGLRNMQERMAKVNGRLTLDTEAGSGAKITIEVDL